MTFFKPLHKIIESVFHSNAIVILVIRPKSVTIFGCFSSGDWNIFGKMISSETLEEMWKGVTRLTQPSTYLHWFSIHFIIHVTTICVDHVVLRVCRYDMISNYYYIQFWRNIYIHHEVRLWCPRNYVTFEIQNEEMIAGAKGFFAAVITTFLLIINWH